MSHFDFLQREWPAVHESAVKAETTALTDPRTSCFYARRALEVAVQWVFKHDTSLRMPYQDTISALIHEPSFKQAAGDAVFSKAKLVVRLGNGAVHSGSAIAASDATSAVRELFHVLFWMARTYARRERPHAAMVFDPSLLPRTSIPAKTLEQIQSLQDALEAKDRALAEAQSAKSALDEELAQIRSEVAEAKKAAAAIPDDHDYSEAQTRDLFIDLLLREAGWTLDQPRDREYQVEGMPNNQGVGFVDYVLWGDDGKPLAVVEAKRARKDSRVGQQQAKLYADCLESRFGQRPVIFYTNGYEHWIWDDASHPPRPVQGFYKKSELELLVQRRTSRRPLAQAEISGKLVDRYYQERAIRRVAESFEKDNERKALLVMATGSGKTRTVIALADLLMRCNWAKRILFLADRNPLVNQAAKNFKMFLPDTAPVNLVTDKATEGRVYVSTYPTMMNLIDEMKGPQRRFGVGHFDLVVIDEAHRSVYQKYGAIFKYFDAPLVGLTATPKEEIDRNTYGLFELENGVPTDAYSLQNAVADGFLVPPRSISVPVRYLRDGIRYDDLSDEEKERWDDLEWGEDGSVPDQVDSPAINEWLFNKDTVDKVLEHLMRHGQKVAGGDRLGKTIIFAKNQRHADFIQERFDANYPRHKGSFARTITNKVTYAQSLIDDFEKPGNDPHIAISVDMLDTGIDVPEVVNLVFFKPVRSKTKFWQMVGRGTRLCRDLFGPGLDKQFFTIFDFCQNLEFFKANPESTDGSAGVPLGTRLFRARLELIKVIDDLTPAEPGEMESGEFDQGMRLVRKELGERLHFEVASMNLDNFIVRPKRRLVERFANLQSWLVLGNEDHEGLSHEVAGLPSEMETEEEQTKRFDLLVLNLQLAFLRAEPRFSRMCDDLKRIASLLELQSNIPSIRKEIELIQAIQSDEWWDDLTVPRLESMRKRLRDLVRLIEKGSRKVVYTDFEDSIGSGLEIELQGFTVEGFEKFRAKARMYLREHEDHLVIHKLRLNLPLTSLDLIELERILAESAGAPKEYLERASSEAGSLPMFVRSLVGLDREAAKKALSGFLDGKALSASQLHFLDLVINHLTEHGTMAPARLYESPFTDIAPQGPDQLFSSSEVDSLIHALEEVGTFRAA
ncbi:MAG: DEAD/DEAH box helicase family protein [Fibrobacteres bacterium]|nr:DEAD/DEAH box helicase family protein [Fibrobacterota bacterium]